MPSPIEFCNCAGGEKFAEINYCPGLLLSKPAPNKDVLGGKPFEINKNVLDYYWACQST